MKQLKPLTLLAVFALSWAGCTLPDPGAHAVSFVFRGSDPQDEFVFRLTDPARIQEARDILSGKQKNKTHVSGTVVKKKAAYNPKWRFHLAPDSIQFFEIAMEVCDASIRYVEEHLDEVGGAFLPKNHWCPWASQLVRELPATHAVGPSLPLSP